MVDRSWRVFALVALTLSTACVAGTDEEMGEQSSDLSEAERTIDPNRLLEDHEILGGGELDAHHVQQILDCFSSGLMSYREGNRSAAEIIAEESLREGVSPAYMLGRIQSESLLIESQTARASRLATATGCGCPDGKKCDGSYRGFTKQIVCAAKLVRSYFDALDERGVTVAGLRVGEEKKTLDPCTVTPSNRATAVLYSYTPWVGSRGIGCGTIRWSGSTGVAFHTRKYRSIMR
jgi:hypothetical protein